MPLPLSSPLPDFLALLRTIFHTRVWSCIFLSIILPHQQSESYIHLAIAAKWGLGMSLIPGSCSPILSVPMSPSKVLPYNPTQCQRSDQGAAWGRDGLQEAAKNTATFFWGGETGSPPPWARELVLVCLTCKLAHSWVLQSWGLLWLCLWSTDAHTSLPIIFLYL